LTLLVTWIGADHTNNAFTADDFAVTANFFHRSRNSHGSLLKLIDTQTSQTRWKYGPSQQLRVHYQTFNKSVRTWSSPF